MHILGKLATALLFAVATQQVQAVPVISLSAAAIALHGSASLDTAYPDAAPGEDLAATAPAEPVARHGMASDPAPPAWPNAYSLLLLGAALLPLAGRRSGEPWTDGRAR